MSREADRERFNASAIFEQSLSRAPLGLTVAEINRVMLR